VPTEAELVRDMLASFEASDVERPAALVYGVVAVCFGWVAPKGVSRKISMEVDLGLLARPTQLSSRWLGVEQASERVVVARFSRAKHNEHCQHG
jgi:hypothetical protein